MTDELKLPAALRGLYGALCDGQSRRLFLYRMNFFITGDAGYLDEMDSYLMSEVRIHRKHNTLEELLAGEKRGHGAVLYGTGQDSKAVLKGTREAGIGVVCFCDGNKSKWGYEYFGLPVISPEELVSRYRGHPVIIATSLYAREIYFELREKGVPDGDIFFPLSLYPFFYYPLDEVAGQYFGEDFTAFGGDEVYIDAGCCDGRTIIGFIKACGGSYKRIIGFEPDPENFENTIKGVSGLENTEIYQKAAWDREEMLKFSVRDDLKSAAGVSDAGEITVGAASIDGVLRGEKATFIKMDVEGSELRALMGAKETIKRYRPKLAICVYHKPEDIFEIPLYIQSLVPEYKLYLRHYGIPGTFWETVLYAVI